MHSSRWLYIVALGSGLSAACDLHRGSGTGAASETGEGTTTGDLSGTGSVPGDASPGPDADGTGPVAGSSSSGAGDDDAASDDACPFVCVPDLPPAEPSCDPVAQDCPAGEKCVWYVDEAHGNTQRRDAARCIEVTGDGQPFEPCSLPTGIGPEITDDCGAESYCLEVYGTADHGFCAPFLGGNELRGYDCSEYPGTHAVVENGSVFPATCLYACNPLLADTCPEAMQCTYYPASLYAALMCWIVPPEAERPLGAACDYGECGEGKLCALAEWVPGCASERCCTEWCDTTAPACDDPAATCEAVAPGSFEPEFQKLGACVLPGTFE